MTSRFKRRQMPPKKSLSNHNTAFIISSLPPLVSVSNLIDFSQQFGTLSSLDMLTDKHTGDVIGKAKVVFKYPPDSKFTSYEHFFDEYRVEISTEDTQPLYDSPFQNRDEGFFALADLMMGAFANKDTFAVEWQSRTNSGNRYSFPPKFRANFEQHRFLVLFNFMNQSFKAHISLQSIDKKIHVNYVDDKCILTFELKRAPLLWRQEKNTGLDSRAMSWRSSGTWKRATSLLSSKKSDTANSLIPPISFYNINQDYENFGSWPVWRLHFSLNHNTSKKSEFFQMIHELKNLNLIDDNITFPLLNDISADKLSTAKNFPSQISFNSLYCIESILSLNYIYRRNLTPEFMNLLVNASSQDISRITERIWAEEKTVLDPISYFKNEINQPSILNPKVEIPHFAAMIHKAVVTPTRICILPPTLETTNRVLRHFSHVSERFLRVVFGDEDFRLVHSNVDSNQNILKRIFNVLHSGLKIANRHYSFLAFSSSQLREHSCWFFSECESVKVSDIHNWMGDFSQIPNVAKYAARMGQCFSSSRDVARLKIEDFKEVPDIENNGFVFTDGVGKISQSLVRHIAYELELPIVPSAIQFRMGGFKGMLAMWPSLKDGEVHLRPSQKKFESKHSILEVIRVATFSSSHLNRQIITILSALGIGSDVFIKIQKDMIAELNKIHNDASLAIQTLIKYTDEFGVSNHLTTLLSKGFLDTSDFYIKNCLRLFFTYALNELKIKARIHVPKGALLLGVVDETGLLQENQIFLQCTDPLRGDTTSVVVGESIVTRNPCFHPGDIRVVTAVDIPELHHLVNVVVFSSVGSRDLPSQCSGGDLDGDEFTVIWDPRLIPKDKDQEPMFHNAGHPNYVEKVSISDIKRFFVDYIINDNLGQIANAHLVHADMDPAGAHCNECLQLARLHSHAVDFAKTGVPAEFDKDLKVDKFPDFMQKFDKQSYISEKILGLLFRSLDFVEFCPHQNIGPDPRLLVEGHTNYILDAIDNKIDYDAVLKSLMNQYGIRNELEATCGYILTHREMVKKTSFQLKRNLMTTFDGIKKNFRRRFESEFMTGGKLIISQKTHQNILRKASAWYFVSYDPDILRKTKSHLNSFAWLVSDYLSEILDGIPKVHSFSYDSKEFDKIDFMSSKNASKQSKEAASHSNNIYAHVDAPLNMDQFYEKFEGLLLGQEN